MPLKKVNIGEIVVKKSAEELTNKDWVVLNSLFLLKDIARILNANPATTTSRVKRALTKFMEIEHPVEQGEELMKAVDDIVERGKALQKAGVQNQMPELGLLAQVSVWTILDIIKDKGSNRQDKLRGASELRKFLETAMDMRETFLKTEAMSTIIEILKEVIGELSAPLRDVFAKKILTHEKLQFLLRGF